MVQLNVPEGVRPFLAGVVRYHFWILAACVPLILLPVLSAANSVLRDNIAARQGQIDAKLSDLRTVTAEDPHPNETWSAAIDADTGRIEAETGAEWRRLWHSQAGLRVWSPTLGDDFLRAIATLGPGDKLGRPLLIRYQNMAPRLVRELPARMGVAIEAADQPAQAPAQAEAPAAAAANLPPLTWNADDQARLFASFDWTRIPSTTQVVMAQEELWVYGMFCDVLASFTRGATGRHDSPLILVEKLAVGFPAIEAQPGAAGSKRLFVPPPDPSAPDSEEAPFDAPPPSGPETAPQHPRFGGAPQAAPSDDDFRSWVYVDFSGKGLTAAQLAEASPMFHLMPFTMRLVIDQRQLDRFLVMLATWPVPIDVRQVRINAGGGVEAPANGPRGRPHDISVELRGTVGLATPPDSKPAASQPDAADPAAAQAALPRANAEQRLREDAA